MITLKDFQSASFEKKCDWVTGYSNFLSTRRLGDAKVYLYHAGEFFIEVYYSPTYKKVLMINAFSNISSLDPYLDSISLYDLGINL
ncbi:MAG: hypothetical protein JST48_11415 [Bacteroidetes bacterium]|nr:hypothetical protein [Bacteroidota bacterium]